jgi:hypothetical protein
MEGIKQTTEISPTIITARMGENVTLKDWKNHNAHEFTESRYH